MPKPAKSGRFEWLDLFRGLAALVVVGYHLNLPLGLPRIEFGFLAVDLFFVLSGIVLGLRYEAAISQGMATGDFIWARVRRLYPMVLITLSLIAVIVIAGLPSRAYAMFTAGTLASLTFVFPYPATRLSGMAFPADPVVWSLCAEFVANALWFVLVKFGRRAAFVGGAISMGLFLACASAYGSFDIGSKSSWAQHVGGWSAALGWFTVGYAIAVFRPRLKVPNLFLVGAFFACCAVCQARIIAPFSSNLLIVIFGCLLLIGLMQSEPQHFVTRKLCSWLGMLSYPLYMIHFPASRVAEWTVSKGIGLVPAYLVTVLGIAIVATLLNEAIVRRLPSRLARRAVAQNIATADRP